MLLAKPSARPAACPPLAETGQVGGQEDRDEPNSEASTMRQMALPRGKSGAKSCRSASSGDTPSWAARAATRLGVRSVRVVPGWMQLTVIP